MTWKVNFMKNNLALTLMHGRNLKRSWQKGVKNRLKKCLQIWLCVILVFNFAPPSIFPRRMLPLKVTRNVVNIVQKFLLKYTTQSGIRYINKADSLKVAWITDRFTAWVHDWLNFDQWTAWLNDSLITLKRL